MLHQFFDPVHHGLQIVHRHFHAVFAVVGLIGAIARFSLFGQHAHVIIRRFTQFLHQFRDFGIGCAVAHRLGQPFLRAAQPFAGIGKAAILQLDRKIPQRRDNLGLCIVIHADQRDIVHAPDDRAQAQIHGFRSKDILGPV